ncbi:MAG TPA: DUF5678 domain-containing protein [archaeon]|nr:DUF5678 domain-containing protein [archaeon]
MHIKSFAFDCCIASDEVFARLFIKFGNEKNKMAEIDSFLELQRIYGGQYIALYQERVVAYAKTFGEVSEALRKIGLSDRVGVRQQFVQPRRAG